MISGMNEGVIKNYVNGLAPMTRKEVQRVMTRVEMGYLTPMDSPAGSVELSTDAVKKPRSLRGRFARRQTNTTTPTRSQVQMDKVKEQMGLSGQVGVARLFQGKKRQRPVNRSWMHRMTTVSAVKELGLPVNSKELKDGGVLMLVYRSGGRQAVENDVRKSERSDIETSYKSGRLIGRWWLNSWCTSEEWNEWMGRLRNDMSVKDASHVSRISGLVQNPSTFVNYLMGGRYTRDE